MTASLISLVYKANFCPFQTSFLVHLSHNGDIFLLHLFSTVSFSVFLLPHKEICFNVSIYFPPFPFCFSSTTKLFSFIEYIPPLFSPFYISSRNSGFDKGQNLVRPARCKSSLVFFTILLLFFIFTIL